MPDTITEVPLRDRICADCKTYVDHTEDHCRTCCECHKPCSHCRSMVDEFFSYRGRDYCKACEQALFYPCDQCGERTRSEYMYNVGSGSYCPNCVWPCEEGSYHLVGNDCSCHNSGRHSVRGYGHTRPTMFLGGPLPKNERGQQIGYYIGFELEISSPDRNDASAIKAWQRKHFGNRDVLDCKSDSSVAGFEIATQPMTPEFFESVDWEGFMKMLDENYETGRSRRKEKEPHNHGLHVHIGRVAFRSDVNVAAFAYLLAQANGTHLERIGRRKSFHYCEKTENPVSQAIVSKMERAGERDKQTERVHAKGARMTRGAINMSNSDTIEIRAFRSTRDAQALRNAVRVVYLAADYVRDLIGNNTLSRASALQWSEFAKWVELHHPEAHASIVGADGSRAPREE